MSDNLEEDSLEELPEHVVVVSNRANRPDREVDVLGHHHILTGAVSSHWVVGVELKETDGIDMSVRGL
jgi:hypothetical protein